MKINFCLAMALVFVAKNASALEQIKGKVTLLEPSYLPGVITFRMDTGSTSCPAGKWLKWQKSEPENNKAVYSTLMAALMADKTIRFYINDGDTNCIGQAVHLIK